MIGIPKNMDNTQRYQENEKLVYHVLKKSFPTLGMDEDIIQEAKIGLWKACVSFREELGYSFSTYACKVIYTTILSVLRKSSHTIEGRADISIVSLHQPISLDDSELTIEDTLPGESDGGYVIIDYRNAAATILSEKDWLVCEKIMRGMSQGEIAERHGVTRQCISAQLMRIRKKLGNSEFKC